MHPNRVNVSGVGWIIRVAYRKDHKARLGNGIRHLVIVITFR